MSATPYITICNDGRRVLHVLRVQRRAPEQQQLSAVDGRAGATVAHPRHKWRTDARHKRGAHVREGEEGRLWGVGNGRQRAYVKMFMVYQHEIRDTYRDCAEI